MANVYFTKCIHLLTILVLNGSRSCCRIPGVVARPSLTASTSAPTRFPCYRHDYCVERMQLDSGQIARRCLPVISNGNSSIFTNNSFKSGDHVSTTNVEHQQMWRNLARPCKAIIGSLGPPDLVTPWQEILFLARCC